MKNTETIFFKAQDGVILNGIMYKNILLLFNNDLKLYKNVFDRINGKKVYNY